MNPTALFRRENLALAAVGCLVFVVLGALLAYTLLFLVLPTLAPATPRPPTDTPAVAGVRCRLVTLRVVPAYTVPRPTSGRWADLDAGRTIVVAARSGRNWYGFVPGTNDPPSNPSLTQLRWVNPRPEDARIDGNCDLVPLIDLDSTPTPPPQPVFPEGPAQPTAAPGPTAALPPTAPPDSGDRDFDGVPDVSDQCPDTPGDPTNIGCPAAG